MIKFLKENSFDMFRMFLNQIAMAVFGLVMSVATYSNDTLFLAFGVFGIAFYCIIIYITARSIGEKDCAPNLAGRRKETPLHGLFIGIGANIINIICGLLIFVCSFYLVAQPQALIYNENGEQVSIYLKDTENNDALVEVKNLYSDKGDDIFTYDNGKNAVDIRTQSDATSAQMDVYDADGNELTLYSTGLNANITQGYLTTKATTPYSISFLICTFTQSVFSPVRYLFFGNVQWYYLLTPILPILAAALGYFLASRGKRLLPFLPEMKTPKRYRS